MRKLSNIKSIYFATLNKVAAHKGISKIGFNRLFNNDDFQTNAHFIDYVIVPPGSSIGLHTHYKSEEIYFILEGKGNMILNSNNFWVEEGDIILNTVGGSHSLVNNSKEDIRLLVIEVGLFKSLEDHTLDE